MRINLEPVVQTGHNCKITAIAAVENYFAQQLGLQPIPLHKRKTAAISIRQLSKAKGSKQGELLESRQLSEIFAALGYETEVIDFQNNFELFQENIPHHIEQGNLLIACFAVDRYTAEPSSIYERNNEHAAVLHGFDDETFELHLTHWDTQRTTDMWDFYESSMALPTQRNPEYYINVKNQYRAKKYELHFVEAGQRLPSIYKKSITPAPDSGFRGKLFVIKKPKLINILRARNQLFIEQFRNLLSDLRREADKPIDEENKRKDNAQYSTQGKIAEQLNTELEGEIQRLIENPMDFNAFKTKCTALIQQAEPKFKKHHGWHQVKAILRSLLGILAGITIIPALVIAAVFKQGYIGTFFKPPKTDYEQKLELLQQNLNNCCAGASSTIC